MHWSCTFRLGLFVNHQGNSGVKYAHTHTHTHTHTQRQDKTGISRLSLRVDRARLKRDGTRAETRFGLSEKWTSPFKSAGESVQSTAGSRTVRISGQTMDRPCSEVQCKSSGYPLQPPISPSLPLPRVTVCHHVSDGPYFHSFQFLTLLFRAQRTTSGSSTAML